MARDHCAAAEHRDEIRRAAGAGAGVQSEGFGIANSQIRAMLAGLGRQAAEAKIIAGLGGAIQNRRQRRLAARMLRGCK